MKTERVTQAFHELYLKTPKSHSTILIKPCIRPIERLIRGADVARTEVSNLLITLSQIKIRLSRVTHSINVVVQLVPGVHFDVFDFQYGLLRIQNKRIMFSKEVKNKTEHRKTKRTFQSRSKSLHACVGYFSDHGSRCERFIRD